MIGLLGLKNVALERQIIINYICDLLDKKKTTSRSRRNEVI